nr:uncharacterized protein LOC118082682 [Zootoca vivipara]
MVAGARERPCSSCHLRLLAHQPWPKGGSHSGAGGAAAPAPVELRESSRAGEDQRQSNRSTHSHLFSLALLLPLRLLTARLVSRTVGNLTTPLRSAGASPVPWSYTARAATQQVPPCGSLRSAFSARQQREASSAHTPPELWVKLGGGEISSELVPRGKVATWELRSSAGSGTERNHHARRSLDGAGVDGTLLRRGKEAERSFVHSFID